MVGDAGTAAPISRLHAENAHTARTAESRTEILESAHGKVAELLGVLNRAETAGNTASANKSRSALAKLNAVISNSAATNAQLQDALREAEAGENAAESELEDAAIEDAEDDAHEHEYWEDHNYRQREQYYSDLYEQDPEEFWHQRAEQDFTNNPFVDPSTGQINDLAGFARYFGFGQQDYNMLRHVDSGPLANDAGVRRNPTLYGALASHAQVDPQVRDALNNSQTPQDVASNHMTAIGRELRYMRPEDREKIVARLDEWQRSQTLTDEQKKTVQDFRHFVNRGWLDRDAIEAMQRGDTFNNFAAMQQHVDRARARHRETLGQAADVTSPEAVDRLRSMAQANGIDTSKPTGEWLADLGRSQLGKPEYEQAFAPIRESAQRIRGANAYVDVINALDRAYPNPADRDRLFYNKTPEERMQLVRDLYNQSNGQPMTVEMERMVRFQAEHIRTPADVGHMMAAAREGRINEFYSQRVAQGLQERAQAGDANAVRDLQNLGAINDHIKQIASSNPELARDIQQRLRSAGLDQIATGTVDYAALAKVTTDAIAAHVQRTDSGRRISEQQLDRNMDAVDKAKALAQEIVNPNGVQGPSTPTQAQANPPAAAQQPTADSNMLRALHLAQERGAINSAAHYNPEQSTQAKPQGDAQQQQVQQQEAQARANEESKKAAEAAKKNGVSEGQAAANAQSQTVANAGSRAAGQAAARS